MYGENKREILKTDYPIGAELRGIRRFSNRISGHSSLLVASNGVLNPVRNKAQVQKLEKTEES